MKKINLLFDISILKYGLKKDRGRAGTFFVALNLIKEFLKRTDLNVFLYVDEETFFCLDKIYAEAPFLKEVKILYPFGKMKILYNMWKQKRYDMRNNGQSFILVTLMKIHIAILKWLSKLFNKKSSKIFKDIDAYFSPLYEIAEPIAKIPNIKKFLFIHDIIPYVIPVYFSDNPHDSFNKHLQKIHQSDFYFACSEYTKQDYIKHIKGMDADKITVTYNSTAIKFSPQKNSEYLKVIKEKYNIPDDKKYIFTVSPLVPHKNIYNMAKSFVDFTQKHKIENMVFVITGCIFETYKNYMKETIAYIEQNKTKIIIIDYVEDCDLNFLYSNAEWFVFTSQYEGFGMPLIEAMSSGTAVITSNNSSLPEVVGDAAIKIDYDSIEQHIEAYEKYYFDEKLRQEYIKKGLEHSKLFTWKKTVDKMTETFYKNQNI